MRVFLDTNVLVAAVVQQHESHARAFKVLERIQDGKDYGFISGHSLAEMYAVLTRFPPPFRHSSEQAYLSIEENVVKYFEITSLSGADYASLIRDAALAGIQGGTIYDAVLLKCAANSEADKLYTLNLKHFQNIAPKKIVAQIFTP
jgi:predicted nucleic acid-binding protein